MNKNIGFTALLNDADIYSWNRLDKDTKSLILKSTFYHWQKRSRYKSLFISCLILGILFLQFYTDKNPFVLTLFLFLFISNVCTIIKQSLFLQQDFSNWCYVFPGTIGNIFPCIHLQEQGKRLKIIYGLEGKTVTKRPDAVKFYRQDEFLILYIPSFILSRNKLFIIKCEKDAYPSISSKQCNALNIPEKARYKQLKTTDRDINFKKYCKHYINLFNMCFIIFFIYILQFLIYHHNISISMSTLLLIMSIYSLYRMLHSLDLFFDGFAFNSMDVFTAHAHKIQNLMSKSIVEKILLQKFTFYITLNRYAHGNFNTGAFADHDALFKHQRMYESADLQACILKMLSAFQRKHPKALQNALQEAAGLHFRSPAQKKRQELMLKTGLVLKLILSGDRSEACKVLSCIHHLLDSSKLMPGCTQYILLCYCYLELKISYSEDHTKSESIYIKLAEYIPSDNILNHLCMLNCPPDHVLNCSVYEKGGF